MSELANVKQCIMTVEVEKDAIILDENGFVFIRYKNPEYYTAKVGDTLSFRCGEVTVPVQMTDSTIFSRETFEEGLHVNLIGRIDGDVCLARTVTDTRFYDMFRMFGGIDDKAEAISKFWALPESVKKSITVQRSGKSYGISEPISDKITDIEGLRFKFKMCRDTYTAAQQADIQGMLNELSSLGYDRSKKEKLTRRLAYILNIDQVYAPDLEMTKEEIIEGLDKYLYNMHKAKERVAEALIAAKNAGKKGMALLLVGPPGVGKTSFVKALSKVIGRPYFSIQLGTATSMIDIVGDAQHYDSSDCGEVLSRFYKLGTTAAVVALDEYGKAADIAKEGGKVSKAFNDALSDEHFFKDVFLGSYINTSNTIFIATTNTTDTIPENLLNRFEVIHLDDFTEEEKAEIAYSYVLPEVLGDYGLNKGDIVFDKQQLLYIAENFCEDDGARDMKKHLKLLVCKVISQWDTSGKTVPFKVTNEFIDASLESYIDKSSPVIVYRRNRGMYTKQADTEIRRLINECRRDDLESSVRDKYEKKLGYLVYAIPTGEAFAEFNEKKFYEQLNKTHYGLDSVKERIAQSFYISAVTGKSLSSNRILLVGPPGIGKTSIVESIAKACSAKYAKISLNGVSDDSVIKGHSSTYVSADAGAVIKAVYGMRTTKAVIHLDEIDKTGERYGVGVSGALIDLLDDSAEFSDNFLGMAVDFSDTLFIATANDISGMSLPLLDRFNVIHLEGYTEAQKSDIISTHVIPKATEKCIVNGVRVTFTAEAEKLLVKKYCRSFGVRDAERTVKKLVESKLYSIRDSKRKKAVIDADFLKKMLGNPSAERGNFPHIKYAGLSRALAVTGDNCGMSFAVETMLIPDEDSFTVTGLPKESTVDSVKLAISYIKRNYKGVLKNKGVHIHFGEGAVPKDGPSAGVAILMSILSAALDRVIEKDVAYTGEINGNGYVFSIGGTIAKIQAAEQSGCTEVFIPHDNYAELKKEDIDCFDIKITPIRHVSEVIDKILAPTV